MDITSTEMARISRIFHHDVTVLMEYVLSPKQGELVDATAFADTLSTR